MIKKVKSIAPKYLYSLKSQIEQFVVIASNSTLGATGLADLCIIFALYIDKIFRNGHDANFYFPGWFSEKEEEKRINGEEVKRTEPHNKKVFEKHVWKYVEENIVSFIYSINQPMRGNQSPFTNVSVYSDSFLDQLIDGYILDGHKPNKETVKKFQELFLDVMNKEMERTPLTFPVITGCFVVDDNNRIPEQDEQFLDMISEKNLKYGFINIYCGKSSTLSSCCFCGEELITIVENDKIVKKLPIADFVHQFTKDAAELKIPRKYKITSFNFDENKEEDVYITGVLKKFNNHGKLIVVSVGSDDIAVTPDHVFKVKDIDGQLKSVTAQDLYDSPKRFMIPVLGDGLSYRFADKISSIKNEDYVYDIELEKNHYFYANGILSHNCRLRSDTENRFFNDETFFEVTLEDGTTKKISNKEALKVKNLTSGEIENLYIDEIKDKFSNYELV